MRSLLSSYLSVIRSVEGLRGGDDDGHGWTAVATTLWSVPCGHGRHGECGRSVCLIVMLWLAWSPTTLPSPIPPCTPPPHIAPHPTLLWSPARPPPPRTPMVPCTPAPTLHFYAPMHATPPPRTSMVPCTPPPPYASMPPARRPLSHTYMPPCTICPHARHPHQPFCPPVPPTLLPSSTPNPSALQYPQPFCPPVHRLSASASAGASALPHEFPGSPKSPTCHITRLSTSYCHGQGLPRPSTKLSHITRQLAIATVIGQGLPCASQRRPEALGLL